MGRGLALTVNGERLLTNQFGVGVGLTGLPHLGPMDRGFGDDYRLWPGLTIGGSF